MADRLFAAALLAITLGFAWMAFFVIRAPFQYDPLGPETWPQLLAVVMAPCLLAVLFRPDKMGFGVEGRTWLRLLATVALLAVYAEMFERLGFVLSTFGFATLMARMLGAGLWRSLAFGAVAGVAGYLIAAGLLSLNLPAGLTPRI